MDYPQLMQKAIKQARTGIREGQTPFGAVIANDRGEIIVEAHNTVRADCDSTAHAEINAIRSACQTVGGIDLSGHIMVTTCEPCPIVCRRRSLVSLGRGRIRRDHRSRKARGVPRVISGVSRVVRGRRKRGAHPRGRTGGRILQVVRGMAARSISDPLLKPNPSRPAGHLRAASLLNSRLIGRYFPHFLRYTVRDIVIVWLMPVARASWHRKRLSEYQARA